MKGNWMMEDAGFSEAWEIAAPFTMTSPERGFALWSAVEHIARNNYPGSFVECGCWRGGSAILLALAARRFGLEDRPIFLFDTFEGMTAPSAQDTDILGRSAESLLEQASDQRESADIWAYASIEDVRGNLQSAGIDLERVRLIQGDVRRTARKTRTGIIALLRLDTDFYDSTRAEMEALYPRLCPGGVLIIDDYGHWRGARAAVDEYFEAEEAPRRPLLSAVDYTGRVGVKPPAPLPASAERYDYVPPGLADPDLLPAFPTLLVTDPAPVRWTWLRKNTPHRWRTDARSGKPLIGALSYEEAVLLYNLAKPFAGKPGLEIGCHLAWSTAHLLAAGLDLDVIDPALGDTAHRHAVEESLVASAARSGGPDSARLLPGFSPAIVGAAAAIRAVPWSFAFIDGWHDGDGPAADASAVLPHMAETAMVAFHDLLCPAVAAGLRVFGDAGWQVRVYNTTQAMGIAWRGAVEPPEHVPDPNMPKSVMPGRADLAALSS